MTDRSRSNWLVLLLLALAPAVAWAQETAPAVEPATDTPTKSEPPSSPPAETVPSTDDPAPIKAEPANTASDKTASVSITSAAGAESDPPAVRFDGQVLFDYVLLGDFALDAAGTPSDRSEWGHTRAVFGLEWDVLPSMKMVTRAEALSGTAFGDLSSQGDAVGIHTFNGRRNTTFGEAAILLREAYLDLDVVVGRLKVGRQGVHWGTGMLVNSGLSDPDFGRAQRGNLADRLVFGTKPFALTAPSPWMEDLTLFVALDSAVRDDNADQLRDDEAFGSVFGALVDHRRTKFGFIVSYRQQDDRRDLRHPTRERTQVEALTTDIYFRHFFTPPRAARETFMEAEVALISGHTDRPYLEETFENGADILALGGLMRVGYQDEPNRLFAKLEAGFASGDNDGRDDVARSFRFNSDYQLGLILFDQVLPLMTARSADRVMDPGLVGKAPSGMRFTVNQGAVTNAWYLYPFVRYSPLTDLELRLGYILAQGMADVVDLFQSATRAGYNTTVGGQMPGARMLGQEIDVGARYSLAIQESIKLRLGVEGAVYLPGAAFEGVLEDPVTMVRTTMDVRW